jgi:hypothetical protein
VDWPVLFDLNWVSADLPKVDALAVLRSRAWINMRCLFLNDAECLRTTQQINARKRIHGSSVRAPQTCCVAERCHVPTRIKSTAAAH